MTRVHGRGKGDERGKCVRACVCVCLLGAGRWGYKEGAVNHSISQDSYHPFLPPSLTFPSMTLT